MICIEIVCLIHNSIYLWFLSHSGVYEALYACDISTGDTHIQSIIFLDHLFLLSSKLLVGLIVNFFSEYTKLDQFGLQNFWHAFNRPNIGGHSSAFDFWWHTRAARTNSYIRNFSVAISRMLIAYYLQSIKLFNVFNDCSFSLVIWPSFKIVQFILWQSIKENIHSTPKISCHSDKLQCNFFCFTLIYLRFMLWCVHTILKLQRIFCSSFLFWK